MDVYIGARGCGKTTFLLEQMLKPGNGDMIMLVCNEQMAAYIKRTHRELRKRVFAVSDQEAINLYLISRRGRDHTRLVVDDANLLLSSLLGTEPEIITMTGQGFTTGMTYE